MVSKSLSWESASQCSLLNNGRIRDRGLSVDGVTAMTWPTLNLIRSFEMPGLIFERFESLLLVIWIMQLFATFSVSFYAASLGLSQIFKKEQTDHVRSASGDVFARNDAKKYR